MDNLPIWESMATVYQDNKVYSWYIGGTLSTWQGAPISIAVVLEENNPILAQQIGQSLLEEIVSPPSK